MKPEIIFVSEKEGMVTMKKEDLEALVEKAYQAGRSDSSGAITTPFPQMSMDEARMILHEVPSEEPKKGNEKCSNKLPCGWCSLFDSPCLTGGEQDG